MFMGMIRCMYMYLAARAGTWWGNYDVHMVRMHVLTGSVSIMIFFLAGIVDSCILDSNWTSDDLKI